MDSKTGLMLVATLSLIGAIWSMNQGFDATGWQGFFFSLLSGLCAAATIRSTVAASIAARSER